MKKFMIMFILIILVTCGCEVRKSNTKNEVNENVVEESKNTEDSEEVDNQLEKENVTENKEVKTTTQITEEKVDTKATEKQETLKSNNTNNQQEQNTTENKNTESEKVQEVQEQTQQEEQVPSYIGIPDPNDMDYSFHHGVIQYKTYEECYNAGIEMLFNDSGIRNFWSVPVRDSQATVLGYYLYLERY